MISSLESALFLSESIIDQLPVILFISDSSGHIINTNILGCTIFQKTRKEMLGTHFNNYCSQKTGVKFENFLEHQKIQQKENLFENVLDDEIENLEIFWQMKYINIPKKGSDSFILLVGSNTNDFQNALRSETLETSRLAAVATLAGGVAHELNNPIAILSLYLQRFADDQSLDSKFELLISKMQNALTRISSVVNSLRDFTSDSSNYKWQEINVKVMLERVAYFLAYKLEVNGISLSLPKSEIEPIIQGNYNRHFLANGSLLVLIT